MRHSRLKLFLVTTLFAALQFGAIPRASALDVGAMASYWDTDDGGESWGVGGKVGLPLFTDYIKLEARACWFPEVGSGRGSDINLIPVDGGLSISLLPGKNIDPYIIAGAGYVFVESDEIDFDGDVGGYVGAGAEIKLTDSFEFFTELLYRSAELDSGIVKDDYEASGVTLNLGLQFDL